MGFKFFLKNMWPFVVFGVVFFFFFVWMVWTEVALK